MYQILDLEDYNLQKLGTSGGGTEYETITTEKLTDIEVTDVAKRKGKLLLFGNTYQKQLAGKNIFNEDVFNDKTSYQKTGNYYAYVELPETFKTKFYANMFLKGTTQNLVAGFTSSKSGTFSGGIKVLNNGSLNSNVECDFSEAEQVYFAVGNSNFVDIETDIDALFNNYNIQCTLQAEVSPTYEEYCGRNSKSKSIISAGYRSCNRK